MRFATDTGGTFTDLVVEDDDGSIRMYKALTTPADPVRGVLDTLEVAARDRGVTVGSLLGSGDTFIHGTTHGLNAIVTGTTARTALLVTAGHRDILLFREGGRQDPFDHRRGYPAPYVPRALTFEITERTNYAGTVLEPLDVEVAVAQLRRLVAAEVEAIAVCLLWSTVNPAHELELGRLIERHCPGVPYTLSHRVNPTLREFRRASAAAIDASLKPTIARYLRGLETRLREAGFNGQVLVLTSSGGALEAGEVAASPIRVINSGPSMAPVAGRHYAALERGAATAIVTDTGGTTYDISLVRDGTIPVTRELWIGPPFHGHLVGYPSVDVRSVGAGGGSIARVDAAGLLHVGPQSAGSVPGPACYGRGGKLATLTDAAVVLGFIDPDYFLGGAIPLDGAAARSVVQQNVGCRLGLSVEDAAAAIMELATEQMVQAVAGLAVNQGVDPALAVLVAGGGAGGLNATFVGRRLGCSDVLIPETGAALSAAGAMMSELTAEYARSVFASTRQFDRERVNAVLIDLVADCEAFARAAGRAPADVRIDLVAEARYENQVWEVDVPLDARGLDSTGDVLAFRSSFDATHRRLFTIEDPASEVEIIGIRAQVRCRVRDHREFRLVEAGPSVRRPPSRQAWFAGAGWLETPVMRMSELAPGGPVSGPAIIESPFTTIVVDPAATFTCSAAGGVLIHP